MSAVATDLIAAVQAAGGNLSVADGRLKVEASAPLPADVVEGLRSHKGEVVALLTARVAEAAERARLGAEAYAAADHDLEERIALTGRSDLPPELVENYARLQLMKPPRGVSIEWWYRTIDGGGRFLDAWGTEAVRLGYTAMDIFGVGRDAPEARHDLKGLVALLDGAEVIALTADKATIRNPAGRVLSIYRSPAAVGQVALWELSR